LKGTAFGLSVNTAESLRLKRLEKLKKSRSLAG
jgi:hypothetical protein